MHSGMTKEKEPRPEHVGLVHQLLVHALADLEAGRLRPLEHYQGLFPGHAELVRREYEQLVGGSPERPSAAQDGRYGRYRILSAIGRGGQGSVFAALDPASGARVALKILPPLAALDRLCRLRLEREAKVLERLEHPCLARVLELGLHAGVPFVVTELVEGETLAEHIARGATRGAGALEPTLLLFERLALALHAAHDAGVVHRDFKPANVVVRPDGTPVLVDFGLARDERHEATSLTREGEVFGTFVYMPPELVTGGSREADRRSDVYSLGVSLHEALTGAAPFAGGSRAELLDAIVRSTPRDPRALAPWIPPDLALVVLTALAKSPDERYRTAQDLALDLERVRRREPIGVRRPSLLARLRRFVARDPGASAALAVLSLALLGCVGVVLGWLAVERSALAQSESIADVRSLAFLERQRVASWPELPAAPTVVGGMDAWIAAVEALRARLPAHRARLAASRTQTAALAGPALEQREHGRLAAFVAELAAYEPKLALVRRRRERAASLPARSIEAHAAAWAATCAVVRAHPAYAGLELAPQVGLVPLGADPDSGLFEFAHLPSGAVPARDAQSGKLVLTDESAIVLVLLPGGTFVMGADLPDKKHMEGEPNVDPSSWIYFEWPAHPLTLEPFLLSKYELTQAQWQRLTGENPSRWRPGVDPLVPISLLHPVTNVGWTRARDELAQWGLVLPTEAQWEYGARGGTSSVWWTGNERESLRGAANLADRSAIESGFSWPASADWPEYDDGYVAHAPVGALRANPFGLHHVQGNVIEWCRDEFFEYAHPARPGDGLREGDGRGNRVMRGGGFYDGSWEARSACRNYGSTLATASRGIRPAWELTR